MLSFANQSFNVSNKMLNLGVQRSMLSFASQSLNVSNKMLILRFQRLILILED